MRALSRHVAVCAAVFAGGASVAGCDQVASVVVVEVRPFRDAERRVVVDVDVEGVEQSGRTAGAYCVSLHVFPLGFPPTSSDQPRYTSALEVVEQCDAGLGDGDRRTFRFVTARTDYVTGQPLRVQVRLGRIYDREEAFVP